jgi:hypothetical protein
MSSEPASFDDSAANDRSYSDDVAPVPIGLTSDRMAAEAIALDTMRSAVVTSMPANIPANFEPDDLDVPAFLRKRNEVM